VQAETITAGEVPSRMNMAIFLLILAIPAFSTVLYGAVDSATWVFISVIWLGIILLWLAESWKAGGFVFDTNLLQLPLAGLLLIGLVQLLPFGGGAGALSLDPYSTRFFVLRLVIYTVFFAACLAFVNDENRIRTVSWTIVIFGATMAFVAILQRLAVPEGIYGVRPTTQSIPFGPFVNGHHFAAFLEMAGGLAIGLLMGRATTRDKKLLLAIAVVIMAVALVLTRSRGGLIAFVAVAALAGTLRLTFGNGDDGTRQRSKRRQKLIYAASAIALIICTLSVVLLVGGGDSLLRGIGVENADADVTSGRAHFWPAAIKIFLEHPIIGAGFDSFRVAFTRFDTWNGTLLVERAHNEYLQTLADSGIAGIVCVAAFIALLFKKALGVIRSAENSFRQDAAIGALAGCFGILVHSIVDFPLRTHSNTFVFLLLCCIAVVTVSNRRSSEL